MYHYLVDRRRDAVNTCVQLLREFSREMALDPRFYHHISQGPGSISSATSSEASALTGITGITSPSVLSTSASAATLRSTASSPSLRAREGVAVTAAYQDGMASPSPGGNVRVVVRVRKFLPRGTSDAGKEKALGLVMRRARVLTTSRRNSTPGRMPNLDGPPHTNDSFNCSQAQSR